MTHFTLLLGMAAPLWLSAALLPPPAPGAADERMHATGGAAPAWPAGVAGIFILGGRGAVRRAFVGKEGGCY